MNSIQVITLFILLIFSISGVVLDTFARRKKVKKDYEIYKQFESRSNQVNSQVYNMTHSHSAVEKARHEIDVDFFKLLFAERFAEAKKYGDKLKLKELNKKEKNDK